MTMLLATVGMSLQSQTLTVDSCRSLALQFNRQKQMASLQTRQAELTRKSTRALFLPDFSLSGGVLYETGKGTLGIDMNSTVAPLLSSLSPVLQNMGVSAENLTLPDFGVDYKLGWISSAGLMVTQPIYMGGKIRPAYSMSKTAVEIARQNERLTDSEVIQQVDEAYAQVVKAEELVEVAQSYRQMLEQLDKDVEAAVRHGLRHRNDRMKVQVKLNDVDLQLLKAQNGVTLSKMNLNKLIGREMTRPVDLSHEYPVVADMRDIRQGDVSLRPEVAMLDGQVEVTLQQVKQMRSELLPQVALMARYGYTHGVELNNRTLLNDWNFSGGVTVSIPLYHFGERQNKVKAAELKQQQIQLERDEKVEQMVLELTRAGQNVEEARSEVGLAQKMLEQAGTNMKLSRQQYDAGFETLSDLLESQAQWQQAYESVVEANFHLYLQSVIYLKAAGLLVP